MFFDNAESVLAEKFEKNGYVVVPVADKKAFKSIQEVFVELISKSITTKKIDLDFHLNQIHEFIPTDTLNAFRLSIIQGVSSTEHFREWYYQIAKPYLEILVGNELAMQRRVNLSIQYPDDESSLLPVHADTWSGDSPFEIVVWVPLVDCFGTKAMFILPPEPARSLHSSFSEVKNCDSEKIFQLIEKDIEWIEVKKGQILIFNQTLPHGNRVNLEKETRWSMNCRFKGVFTPYADKKLGEFFEPITLKPLSKIAMNYRLPNLS